MESSIALNPLTASTLLLKIHAPLLAVFLSIILLKLTGPDFHLNKLFLQIQKQHTSRQKTTFQNILKTKIFSIYLIIRMLTMTVSSCVSVNE